MKSHELHDFIFNSYGYFINYAREIFPQAERKGLFWEEYVNEAIVHVFDATTDFKSGADLSNFIKTSIRTAAYHEKDLLKDYNFYTVARRNEDEHSLVDRGVLIDTPSSEFMRVYEIMERCRFGEMNEKKYCSFCNFSRFYELQTRRGVLFKCKHCGHKSSLASHTSVHNMKIGYVKLYKIATLMHQNPLISSHELARRVSITQKTAWYRRQLFLSVLRNLKNPTVSTIMSRILTVKHTDNDSAQMLAPSLKFSQLDVFNIRRLIKYENRTTTEVARMYASDASTVRKIVSGKLYNSSKTTRAWEKSGQLAPVTLTHVTLTS